jgi:hypothetical protein
MHERRHADTEYFDELGIAVTDPVPQEDDRAIRRGLWRAIRYAALFWAVVGLLVYATCFHVK